MTNPASSNLLSSKQTVTLVLRLVLDEQGRLEHGELVDLTGKNAGRFNSWDGLVSVLDTWLDGQGNAKRP